MLSYIRSWFECVSGAGCVLPEVSHRQPPSPWGMWGCSPHALGPQVSPGSSDDPEAQRAFSGRASGVSEGRTKLPRASLRKCWSLGSRPHGGGLPRCRKEEPVPDGSHPGCSDGVVPVRPSKMQTPGRPRQARDGHGLVPPGELLHRRNQVFPPRRGRLWGKRGPSSRMLHLCLECVIVPGPRGALGWCRGAACLL